MVTRNLNPGSRRRTLPVLSLSISLLLTGCGLGYVAAYYQATRDDSSKFIDQSQPDLVVTNLQGATVATIVASEANGVTAEFFEPISFNVLNAGDDIAPAGYSVTLFLSKTKTINSQSIPFRRVAVKKLCKNYSLNASYLWMVPWAP